MTGLDDLDASRGPESLVYTLYIFITLVFRFMLRDRKKIIMGKGGRKKGYVL